MTRVRPRKSRRRGGRRGPSEDEGGAGVCRVGDEEEGNEGFHPQVEISLNPSAFGLLSVENGKCFRIVYLCLVAPQ